MLWSFLKVALFVIAVGLVTMGAAWLSDWAEAVRVSVAGMEFTLGPLQAVIAVLLLVLIVWLAVKIVGLVIAFLKFLNGDETALSRYFDRNRERRGFQALSDGMLALAAGDGRTAMAKAAKADRLLERREMTALVMAQAAELQGDRKLAIETYKRLLSDERTRFVGVRGLMLAKLAEGETETALRLAEKAFEMKPKNIEVQDLLLRLQTESGDWAGARGTLAAKSRMGKLPKEVFKRRDALLALQEAKGVLDEGRSIEAREAAISANRASPDLIPAAVMAARSYIEAGNAKYATRVIRKAWEMQPHPDLAGAFAAIEPDEAPPARLKRFETLFNAAPGAEETALTRAELMIAAEDFPGARRALSNIPEKHPTARSLTLMAAIARGEGADEQEVRAWLTRAVSASRGPQWICDKCQTVAADWAPVCPSCGGFDTLSWREAPDMPPLPNGAEMLPLVVGGPRAATGPAPDAPKAAPPEPELLDPEPAAPKAAGPATATAAAAGAGAAAAAAGPTVAAGPVPEAETPAPAAAPAAADAAGAAPASAPVVEPAAAEEEKPDPFAVPPSVAAARGLDTSRH
ncbi:heme biosynthesis protein HemY [Frigidibacter sp. MR17.24]|uniref:heme biosynthesis protein HemY n=1 Tax=Frigidibacter sp. MR17.24 TaxID=3127345 RepID=UPI003FA5BA6D